jgi:SPOR domain
MAKRPHDAKLGDGLRASVARKSWRFGLWGGLAFVSLGAAVLAVYSETGSRRLALGEAAAAGPPPRNFDAEAETRRLAQALRMLVADRDRLVARVSALEHNLDDVTGSIPSKPAREPAPAANPAASPLPPALATGGDVNLEATRAPAVPPPAAAVAPAVSPATAAQGPAPAKAAPSAPIVAETAAAASTATKTEFGIDLGASATVEGLRTLWASVKGTQAPLVEGLRPIVAVRDGAKPGTIELRLVVGPLANAGAAARLCAALAAAGLTCQAAVFDGQRLALK